MDDMARQIFKAVGPSGPNRDYLFYLESALENLGEEAGDAHVSQLASKVKALDGIISPSITTPSLEVGEEDER